MLGALALLFGLVGVFFWWLIKNYDEENNNSSEGGIEQQQQMEHHRRRNRGHKKKRKQRGGKDPAEKAPTMLPSPVPGSTGSKERALPALDAQEWPTLANSSQEQEEVGEEDLDALHAEMLKAARNVATEKGAGGKGKAGEGGRAGRKTGRIGVGDRVEGRFEAGAEWFPAVVTKTLHGGLVNLLYDDGERETRVPLSLVRHRGAPEPWRSDSDASSESDHSSEEETELHGLQVAPANKKQADGWEVIVQKPKKTRVERVESRIEANSNLKNRLKRQKKREKELAAREALRKKL